MFTALTSILIHFHLTCLTPCPPPPCHFILDYPPPPFTPSPLNIIPSSFTAQILGPDSVTALPTLIITSLRRSSSLHSQHNTLYSAPSTLPFLNLIPPPQKKNMTPTLPPYLPLYTPTQIVNTSDPATPLLPPDTSPLSYALPRQCWQIVPPLVIVVEFI